MKRITEAIKNGDILISDGAWGTFLYKAGLKAGECPEYWNISNKEVVANVAKAYISAGADIIETNSFGANIFKLSHYGLQAQSFLLSKTSAEISREAAGNKIVMASAGPTGKFLMMDEVTEEEIYNAYKIQAQGFEEGGADAIIIETFYDIEEARQAVKAVKENSNLEVICSFTFENKTSDYRTMMGNSPAEVLEAAIEFGADIVGTNCGFGFAPMIDIIKEMRKNSNIPLLVQANAGLPELRDNLVYYPESPEYFADILPNIIEAGANIIGGCCGTTPEHISSLVKKLKELRK